jgi:hypothetical protein
MFHINNILKYVGLVVFVYFLIKTFSNNNMSNAQIFVVVGLLVMTVLIMENNNQGSCPRRFAEGYKKKDVKKTQNTTHTHEHPTNTQGHPTNTHEHPTKTHGHPTHTHEHPTKTHEHSTNTHGHPTHTQGHPTHTQGHPTHGYSEYSHVSDDDHDNHNDNDDDDDYDMEEINTLKKSVSFNDDVHKKIKEQESKAKKKIISKKKKTNSRTNPLNTVPLGTSHFNYTMMPVENWFRAYDRPPICLPSSNDDDDDEVKPTEHKHTSNLMHVDSHDN